MTADTPLLRRFQEVWKWLASPPREPIDDSADWYAGLPVDPNSFSSQLVTLQTSLRSTESSVSVRK
jgi:hypothetical protein